MEVSLWKNKKTDIGIIKKALKGGNIKMKIKTFLILLFIIGILIPASSYAITKMDNNKMQVTPVTGHNFEGLWLRGFDITGQITNDKGIKEQISSTHNNLGFHVFLNVNGRHGQMNGFYKFGKEKMKEMHYSEVTNDTVQNIDGIDLLVETKYINNGNQIQINYILKNTTDYKARFSLGTSADVEIDGDDKSVIEKINNGEMLKLWTNNGKTKKTVQFVFYGKNAKGVTNIDNLWIGTWSDYYLRNIFNTNPTINKIENCDSAFTFSWVNRTINPQEEQVYSVILEVGENNLPNVKMENNTKLYYSNAVLNGTVNDKDLKDIITIHYTVDEKEYTLPKISTTGIVKNFSIDLTKLNLAIGRLHTLKVWATDSTNCKGNVEESNFVITALKNPLLTLSEENWTKNDVVFKINDTENLEQYIKKYQYRINNEEWIDIAKDIEKEINKNGENKIDIRIIGTEQDDISEVITKYSKIDKINPTTTKPTATKTTNSITVNIEQKDEHSGIDNEKNLYAIKQETNWSEWQTSNVFSNLKDNTTYIIKTKATDNVGNTSESQELTIKTDISNENNNSTQNSSNTISNEIQPDVKIPDSENTIIDEPITDSNNTTNENKEIDNTVANIKIPQTGENDIILVMITFFSAVAIHSYWKLKNIK